MKLLVLMVGGLLLLLATVYLGLKACEVMLQRVPPDDGRPVTIGEDGPQIVARPD